jgi:UPF0716 family protein affecting phage T7 exclusion
LAFAGWLAMVLGGAWTLAILVLFAAQ